MADSIGDYVIDNGLNAIHNLADKIYVCNAAPSTFTEATSTFALGVKIFPVGSAVATAAAGTPNGRVVSTVAFSNGNVTASGTARNWAIIDSSNSRLLAHGTLAANIAVTSGTFFQLPSFNVRIPNS